jgi:hypothetical protein
VNDDDGVIDKKKYAVYVAVTLVFRRLTCSAGRPAGETVLLVAVIVVPLEAVDDGSCSEPLKPPTEGMESLDGAALTGTLSLCVVGFCVGATVGVAVAVGPADGVTIGVEPPPPPHAARMLSAATAAAERASRVVCMKLP